ncbi:TraI/MobA(P) family conjugative relaxase [Desulfopila sp. IMCC35006]|uniref:TraI/MobA(P) family conjugative relaxase n=1 Tax=Desulfopila sp. IMCC35006 TaxID=2569542 RepID=UPI001F0F3938|nr:TraI/MobA(P) family conjugative relaxase [Desulfopila sp. IMCC35006]
MIAKRINTKPGNDNSRQLGLYIADASHEGEKLLFAWHEGCLSETYEVALIEIEATQGMNTRCQGGKTYHLMVSFRPEDEAKLTPESMRDIEAAFAQALGFDEHQRLCGVHRNTNNMHLHVAYNMIHPEKFTKYEPFRDFYKLAEACRAMETKYDLVIDNGVSPDRESSPQIDQRAASMEAHSGEQSFQSYVLEHKGDILKMLEGAENWQELHTALAGHGLEIKPRGNGLVVVNTTGKGAIKASTIDRSISKKRLTDRLGEYSASIIPMTPNKKYDQKPIQPRSEERTRLYPHYKKLLEERNSQLGILKQQAITGLFSIRERHSKQRKDIEQRILPRKTKSNLRQILNVEERLAREKESATGQDRLQEVRERYPFHNWNGYLKWQSQQGNATALEVLRSRTQSNDPATAPGEKPADYYQSKRQIKLNGVKKEQQLVASNLTAKHRGGLIAITRMEQLAAQETLQQTIEMNTPKMFSGVRHTIDNNGIVIFTLPSGGTIRDAGKKLHFSLDKATQRAALIYGQARFGKHIQLIDNTIERKKYERNNRNRTRDNQPHFAGIKQIYQNGLRKLSELNVVRFGKRTKMLLPDHARGDMER